MSSNQVALFQGNIAIPAYLQTDEVDAMTRALAGGAGGLRVSIKGGVFRLINNGDEIARNEERAMNFVIVASSEDNSRNFYADKYVEGENKPPTCWSSDGVTPDEAVKNKQSPQCATCQQNIAGSGDNGSRACKYSRRLAVVVENDIGGSVYQMQLPAQSIFGKPEADGKMPLQAYAKQLASHRIPANRVVTEFRFDTNSPTPKLTFRAIRPLNLDEIKIAEAQGMTPDAQSAIKMTAYAQDNGGSNDAPAALPPQAATQNGAGAPSPAPNTIGNTATVPAQAAAAVEQAGADAGAPAAAPAAKVKKPKAAAAPAASTPPTTNAGASVPPPAPRPAPPAAPPAAPRKVMTAKAGGASYEAFVEQGWTDEAMIADGFMVLESSTPRVVPPATPPAPAPAGVASVLASLGADDDDD